MNVLLIARNMRAKTSPLAIGCLKAAIDADPELGGRANVDLLALKPAEGVEAIVEAVARLRPGIVGFSCYVWNVQTFLEACAALKKAAPGALLVLGGPETAEAPERRLSENPAVDAIVVGEGELAFGAIVRRLVSQQPSPFDGVAGVTHRSGNQISQLPPAPAISEWDRAPSPYLSGVLPVDEETHILLETQRGCPYRCTFCFYRKGLNSVRYVPWERTRREIDLVLDKGAPRASFLDPTFNSDRPRMREVCEYIAPRNKKTVFHAEVRIEWIDDELAELLRRARFGYLEAGVQSTNALTLARIKRPMSLEKLRQGFLAVGRRGLRVEAQIIAGLPGESFETMIRSIEDVDAMGPDRLNVFPLLLLPGTEVREQIAEFEIEHSAAPPYEILKSSTFSPDEVVRAKRIGKLFEVQNDYAKCSGLLRRELSLTRLQFGDSLDAFLRSTGQEVAISEPGPARDATVRSFISDLCTRRGVDPAFYLALAKAETGI